ncbi:MAG: thioredoxin family protein [Dysgonamonadaceae bacterium]|jgi:hypothetical protein|nr:thioredoxin family protein [Dysgonamonadaceae bacterium]
MRYFTRISLILGIMLLCVGAGTTENKLTEGIQPGDLAPEIGLQGVELQGNGYVLVQFWAAYDPQSRLENVIMHNVIAQSKMKNLRLISISLDENPSVFQGVIKADRLDKATQFNIADRTKSGLLGQHCLKNGFGNWLIGPNGVIVETNIRPDELSGKILLAI